MYTKQENDEKLNIAAFDHWSTDTKQDAWFTASSLHAVFEIMSNKPKWIILISDNGPHYHNTEMMLIMAHWKEWYDIEVREWIFLEAGEAKTAIDSHHAQIVHAIKRYVRIGFEIKEGNDIEKAIKDLRGWTLHSILMYTKQENDEKLNIAAFDHWSTDTKQDAWFTASSLHAVFEIMSNKPKWIILISDNGPHYHNTEMMLIMAHWKEWYDIEVREWIFLEAGEAKTAIDSHHAQIVHAIKRYVRIGFEIKEGNDIEKAIKDLRGISIGELNPNREKLDKKIKSLVGISNLNKWKWSIEGPFAGYIQARPLPKIGNYINYSPAQIEKLSKSETIKPKPTLSTPINSQSTWIVPISNFDTNSKRTKIDTLSNENHEGNINTEKNFTIDIEFQLMSGWALKANQKFGKRGGAKMSKRIITLLQGFFHAGNANKSDRYTAHDMLSELNDMATSGELDPEIIPKVETIENWIGRYSAACKREMAAIVLERQEQMNCDIKFQLMSGWALKANQKFGKRGGAKMSKRIITLLQGFFHAGNANKSDRYTAHDMLSELNDMATSGELDPEIIPKVETIENWIGRYSAACKREMAAIVLERQEQMNCDISK
ncbi:hypothetical protein Glove_319g72 [Diversispora epigaea]|uniref:Uncharacterized protein n=1 Tax=Diversispora epigaea TaxID=1348612 RepID=A0A397HU05_9GLOM|nr:hypothetical protein Glove_319g72 [Diversispora epigaea]